MDTRHIFGAIMAAVILFLAPLQSNASAKKPRPFDLSKIPMDDSWEDTGIMASHIAPCGRDYVYADSTAHNNLL